MKTYTKKELIGKLKEIKAKGWIKNNRKGNAGSVGNILEDLLGIKENNLPIPNASEWELKTQRIDTSSLTTLFHTEPSSTALKFVPSILLPKYGWSHQEAGKKYSKKEMSFRQTINCLSRSDRGFKVVLDKDQRKVLISFDSQTVDKRHKKWLEQVKKKAGLGELNPQPYWGFDDLFHKAGTKLLNCFFIQAQMKKERKTEYFLYEKIMMLRKLSLPKFVEAIEKGAILVDFDARTGHNHGTKFRLRQDKLPELYEEITIIS